MDIHPGEYEWAEIDVVSARALIAKLDKVEEIAGAFRVGDGLISGVSIEQTEPQGLFYLGARGRDAEDKDTLVFVPSGTMIVDNGEPVPAIPAYVGTRRMDFI